MRRCKIATALILALVLSPTVQAQGLPPQGSSYAQGRGPVGPAEPTPIGMVPNYGQQQQPRDCPPNLIAPPVSLTNDGTPNAFDGCAAPEPIMGFYAGAGTIALARQKLGKTVVATADPVGAGDIAVLPPPGGLEILNWDDINPGLFFGVRGTLGYQYDGSAVEAVFYYVPDNVSETTVIFPGRVNTPFANFPLPTGFTGNNNLFLHANLVNLQLTTEVLSAEALYRWATSTGWEWIIGLRYFNVDEKVMLFIDDDFREPTASALSVAKLTSQSNNRLLAPTLGFEGEWLLRDWIAVGLTFKGAWGVNFNAVDLLLERGDGFVAPDGPNTHRGTTRFAHMYESELFTDIIGSDRIRFRVGYQFLWLLNVPEAVDQIDFNLRNRQGVASRTDGSIFLHGLSLELHLAF